MRLWVLLCLLLASSAAQAAKVPRWYALGGVGARQIGADDVNKYFDQPGVTEQLMSGGPGLLYGAGAGYYFTPNFALELGLSAGPDRSYGMTYSVGSVAFLKQELELNVMQVFLMPQAGVSTRGIFSKRGYHTLGLKLGPALLSGKETRTNLISGLTGSFGLSGSTFSYGIQYRFVEMVAGNFGVGLELGYDVVRFASLSGNNATGGLATYVLPQPAQTNDGSQAYVDVSGPSIRLVFGAWFTKKKSKADAELTETPADTATAAAQVELGNAALQQKRYRPAEECYRKAVEADKDSAAGWRGLGNALYFQGMKYEAIAAYEKYLGLKPEDEKVREFVSKLRKM